MVRIGQEVKDGPIVPDVDRRHWPIVHHVSFDPRHLLVGRSKSRSGPGERPRRNIEHRDTGHISTQQVVHEARIPAPDVENSGVGPEAGGVQ